MDFFRQFGSKFSYGDASRPDFLHAAQADMARAFVLAIDDVEASFRTAATVRREFPDLPIYARARNRQHVYKLKDLGIEVIERETFRSATALSRSLLKGLGMREADVKRLVQTFEAHDIKWLNESHADAGDTAKLKVRALKATEELEELFRRDAETRGEAAKPAPIDTDH